MSSETTRLVPLTVRAAWDGENILVPEWQAKRLQGLKSGATPKKAHAVAVKGVTCPCCNQLVDVPSVAIIADRFGLSPLQERILEAVWKGNGRAVQTDQIFVSMYRDDPDGGPEPGVMYDSFKVALHYLRILLKGSGVDIENVGYRQGYRLIIKEQDNGGIPQQSHPYRKHRSRSDVQGRDNKPACRDLFSRND